MDKDFLFNAPMTPKCLQYIMFEGKSKTWYVKAVPNMGDEIYCDTKDPNSQGFGGRELTFPLTTGEVHKVIAPWHSNCDAMLADTGVDLTKMHYSRYIIADDLNGDFNTGLVAEGIHFIQDKPILGSFDHAAEHAERIARKLGRNVQYAKQSGGGAVVSFSRVKFNNESA